jgi:hypothetical protein
MNLKRCLIAALIALTCATPLSAQTKADETKALPLESLIDAEGGLWKLDAAAFQNTFGKHGFRWTSAERTSARAYKAPLKFMQWQVVEALANFNDGHLGELILVLYSRGDVGGLSFDAYRQMIAGLGNGLNTLTNIKTPVELDPPVAVRGVQLKTFAWVKPPHLITGEWSATALSPTSIQPEFVRVRLEPFDPAKDPRSSVAAAVASVSARRKGDITTAELRRNLTRADNGDVYIQNVPMVDQGPKGYCAVAATERIMSYYGLEADQHIMAQLAQSSAQGGTSIAAMLGSLSALGPKLGCRVRNEVDFKMQTLQSLSQRYDREAKKAGKPMSAWTPPRIDLGKFFGSMDKDILIDVRTKESQARKLPTLVKTYVDKGIPLTWGVLLGIIPETPKLPQSGGGHLRLIIGYNIKTKELLYTDTWGRGHELKRMSFDNAWVITMGVYVIEPRHLSL